MSQEKDDKSKAPGKTEGTSASSGDASKRPYATLDLKATEVPASKTDAPKADTGKIDPSKPFLRLHHSPPSRPDNSGNMPRAWAQSSLV